MVVERLRDNIPRKIATLPKGDADLRVSQIGAVCCATLLFSLASAAAGDLQISWPTYGFDYANTRHIGIDEINRSNVSKLTRVWRYVLGPHERVETTPIVDRDTMYVTTGTGNNVIALDAVTGREKWRYRPVMGPMAACCGLLNRGVAVSGNRVFVATLDGRMIALDAASGKPAWDVRIGFPGYGFSETMAPLAWDGLVFIGSSGSDYGLRGSVSAYRAVDGKLIWRWYAVSPGWEGNYVTSVHGMSLHRNVAQERRHAQLFRNAWKQGGGAVWMTPALDAKRGALYFTTSNPWPVFHGSARPGDNLYTECIVSLNARTGKMNWYYQQTPHDVWEYEPTSPPVLFDVRAADGNSVQAVGEAGKTLWFYIVDRNNGKLIRLSQSLAPNANAYDDPPDDLPSNPLPLRGSLGPISYDASRHIAFISAIERPNDSRSEIQHWRDFIAAVNVETGKIAWKTGVGKVHEGIRGDSLIAGSLSTGELVFISDPSGDFYALNSDSGAVMWHYVLGSMEPADANDSPMAKLEHRMRDFVLPIKRWALHQDPPTAASAGVDTNPIAYKARGREYIAIGFDAQPERSIGGAMIDAFALP